MGDNTPEPVDIHVGTIIRRRRLEMGVSQQSLAAQLGVSFQQLQKYEKGTNRVSASMLYAAAQAQGVAPSFYFDGFRQLEISDTSNEETRTREFMASREGWAFSNAISRLSKQARIPLLQFVRELPPES